MHIKRLGRAAALVAAFVQAPRSIAQACDTIRAARERWRRWGQAGQVAESHKGPAPMRRPPEQHVPIGVQSSPVCSSCQPAHMCMQLLTGMLVQHAICHLMLS